MRHSTHNLARALTLFEMVVSMSIVTLIIGAVSSAVIVATRAVNPQSSPASTLSSLGEALSRLLEEASLAITVTEHTPTALTFTLPDRTGDSLDDTIRYSWDGMPGDPLQRQLNDDEPTTVAQGITRFVLEYDTASRDEVISGGTLNSDEQDLAYFNGVEQTPVMIGPSLTVSQYVRPQFPRGTLNWTLTSIDLRMRQGSAGDGLGMILIELQAAGPDNAPSGEVLASTFVLEQDLPMSHQWTRHTFTNVPALAPNEGVCIVLSDTSGGVSAALPMVSQVSTRSAAWYSDSGPGIWYQSASLSTPHRIRGTTLTRLPDTTISHVELRRLSAILEADPAPPARGATLVYNRPEFP